MRDPNIFVEGDIVKWNPFAGSNPYFHGESEITSIGASRKTCVPLKRDIDNMTRRVHRKHLLVKGVDYDAT